MPSPTWTHLPRKSRVAPEPVAEGGTPTAPEDEDQDEAGVETPSDLPPAAAEATEPVTDAVEPAATEPVTDAVEPATDATDATDAADAVDAADAADAVEPAAEAAEAAPEPATTSAAAGDEQPEAVTAEHDPEPDESSLTVEGVLSAAAHGSDGTGIDDAADAEEAPASLLFSLKDDRGRPDADRYDVPPDVKPRKTLLGRRRS